MDEALPPGRAGRTPPAARDGGAEAEDTGPEARGSHRAEGGPSRVRDAAGRGRAEAVLGAGGGGEHGAPDPARGRAARGARADAGAGAPGAPVRAGAAERAVAVGPLHVPAAASRAALSGRVHGRPLALPRRPRAGAPPALDARARGARPRDRRLRDPAGDPHRPGPPVHRVARHDGVRRRAPPPGNPTREEPAAAPADAREDRAVLEDALGGVPVANRVRGLRRLCAASRAVRRRLQLPAPAPGARRPGAGGPLLPQRARGARRDRAERAGERAAARAGEAAAAAVLPGGPARRPRSLDRSGRGRAAGEGGHGGADDPTSEGGRR